MTLGEIQIHLHIREGYVPLIITNTEIRE